MQNQIKDVIVTKDEVMECRKFAEKFVSESVNKSGLDFGNNKLPRDLIDKIADVMTGKIGELAFKKVCANLNFKIEVDFDINPGKHNIDFGQDIRSIEVGGEKLTPLVGVDIKTSKENSSWLLLEDHKHWASVLILMIVDLPTDAESNLDAFNKDVNCKFAGFAYLSNFYDAAGDGWFSFSRGDKLLSPSFVNCMFQKATVLSEKIILKSQLNFHNKQCQMSSGKSQIGYELKCPKQVGLQKSFLRNSEKELIELMQFIASVSVPANQLTNEITQAAIRLNMHLSKFPKELKQ